MTGDRRRRDADKSRQELLDELYCLRDLAGEREQRALELEQQARDQQRRLAKLAAALQSVLGSRSWRWTRALRDWLHPSERGAVDRELAGLVAAESAARVTQHEAAGAQSVAPEQPSSVRSYQTPCIFVDVSELALRQGQTGIQRVVREISRALLASPPEGITIELVCAAPGQPYRYAQAFADNFMGKVAAPTLDGRPIEARAGDLFLGLDHAMDAVLECADELAAMRAAGVKLCFVLNDMLPLSRPDWFPPGVSATFKKWFETISRIGDRIVCISQATETEAREWLDRLQIPREQWPALDWFHLGADGITEDAGAVITLEQQDLLERLRSTTSFLVVGTVEPRKGHAQTLEAFNRLWTDGENLTLVVAGRPGWMTEVIQRRIRHHDQFGHRLFWFMDAGDALLHRLYQACAALLAPSEGEGFGLPLVEAAREGLPILCRDLPVFREVIGEHAMYFLGSDPSDLVVAVHRWVAAHRLGITPSPGDVPRVTWAESAQQLLAVVQSTLDKSDVPTAAE